MKKTVALLLNLVPIFALITLLANTFYLSLVSILPISLETRPIILWRGLFLIVALFYLSRHRKTFTTKVSVREFFILFLPFLSIILLRFPMAYPTHDDLAYHFIAGDYANNIFVNKNFMPLNLPTYFYPVLEMNFTPLLMTLGMRITIFLYYLVTSFWMISLFFRFRGLVTDQTKKFLLLLVFIITPFIPHLMAVHGTLMTDYFSIALLLETFYVFVNKDRDKTFAVVLAILAILVKQSSAIFLVPLFIYLIFKYFHQVNWKAPIIIGAAVTTYFVRLYFETGNPLFGLYNGIFRSPLWSLQNFRDPGFGPQNLWGSFLWPIIGQFTDRFGQGYLSTLQKIVYFPILSTLFLLAIFLAIKKRQLCYFIFTFSYLLWSFISGYSRYVIPLNIIFVIDLIITSSKKTVRRLQFIYNFRWLVLPLLALIFINSIKTDFSWRPYPFITPPQDNRYFLTTYQEGWQYLFQDTLPNIKELLKNDFEGYDIVMPVYRGSVTYYAYIGSLLGKKVVAATSEKDYQEIHKDKRISQQIKNNLTISDQAKLVLLVIESGHETNYKNGLHVFETHVCEPLANAPQIPYFQTRDYFQNIHRYRCILK